jgi:hypothetical protein
MRSRSDLLSDESLRDEALLLAERDIEKLLVEERTETQQVTMSWPPN